MALRLLRRARIWWLRRGVRLQITVWYGAALIALLVVLSLLVYWLLSNNLIRDAESQLVVQAAQIEATLNVDESGGGINYQDTQTPGELALIYGDNGILLESSGNSNGSSNSQGSQNYRPANVPDWAKPNNEQNGQNGQNMRGIYNTVTLPGGRWLMYATTIASQGEGSTSSALGKSGALIVGRSLEPIYGMLNETLSALALAGPLVILLACAGGYFVAGRALAPVAAITRAARRIQAEGLGRHRQSSDKGKANRVGGGMEGRHDELGELASTFDAMLERLEWAFARERRFTADAAHELRTPLAVVQAETSLALLGPRRVEEYKRVLTVVEGESARMGRLVTDLLTLARADEGQRQLAREPVDLSLLCHTALTQLATISSKKGLTMTGDIQPGVSALGDDAWLRQMLVNLVDNAIKYTPDGGCVLLKLESDLNTAIISVQDTGIGISEAQLPHIFDRFYRGDKARSRDSEASGVEIGLSICEWIARSHGGYIEASSQLGLGSHFSVYLPLIRN